MSYSVFHMPLTNPKSKTRYASLKSQWLSLSKGCVAIRLPPRSVRQEPLMSLLGYVSRVLLPWASHSCYSIEWQLVQQHPLCLTAVSTPEPHPDEQNLLFLRLKNCRGKIKTYHWLKSRTSRQSHIYDYFPFKPNFPWYVTSSSLQKHRQQLCFALTLQGSSFCFLKEHSAIQYNSFLISY